MHPKFLAGRRDFGWHAGDSVIRLYVASGFIFSVFPPILPNLLSQQSSDGRLSTLSCSYVIRVVPMIGYRRVCRIFEFVACIYHVWGFADVVCGRISSNSVPDHDTSPARNCKYVTIPWAGIRPIKTKHFGPTNEKSGATSRSHRPVEATDLPLSCRPNISRVVRLTSNWNNNATIDKKKAQILLAAVQDSLCFLILFLSLQLAPVNRLRARNCTGTVEYHE